PPPPPPAPPPQPLDANTSAALRPAAFPFGACSARDPGAAPFRLALAATAPASSTGATYCFTVQASRCPASSPCCTMDLNMVSLLVGPQCRGAVQRLTLGGQPLSPSYSQLTSPQGNRYLVFQASRLGPRWPPSGPRGRQLCFTLASDSACPSLRSFCLGYDSLGSCRYALHNEARTCCPTADLVP
ncbi:hypothetical protein QJQ45_017849, partial [Haematococcus lacustris]